MWLMIANFIKTRGLRVGLPVLIGVLLASHAGAYYAGIIRQEDRQAKATQKLEREYLTRLQQRITENAALAAKQREDRDHAEQEYHAAMAEVDRQRRRADSLGRLRDPGRTTPCRPAVPATSGPTSGPVADTTGGDLSAEATEFLRDFARDADRAAVYATACHGWVVKQKQP